MAHLKRYSMPGFWPLARKAESYVTTPMPGPHPKYGCMPLRVIVRDSLKLAESTGEVKGILNAGKVLVDGKVRKEPHFPVGFMDVLEIPQLHARYRMVIGRRGLSLEKISEEEAAVKLCRITGKTVMKGGLHQLNLHDGRNIISSSSYKVGDSLMIGVPSQKILKHFSLKKGEPGLIIAGRNIGVSGKVKDVKVRKSMLEKSMVTIETDKGKDIETLKDYVMVGTLSEIPAGASEKEEPKPKKEKKMSGKKVKADRRRQESPSSSETPSGKESKAEEGQA